MLRRLVRDKATLVAESGDWVRRMQKSLDQMNVRVHRAVSDVSGTTGMAIIRAIAEGERDAGKLAHLRDPHPAETGRDGTGGARRESRAACEKCRQSKDDQKARAGAEAAGAVTG